MSDESPRNPEPASADPPVQATLGAACDSSSSLDAPLDSSSSRWRADVRDANAWLSRHLRSARTRLSVLGVVLLLTGALWVTSSVWTLPLIVVGIVMIVIAWVGARLSGRFAVEWGDGGTQVEFRAQITAPDPVIPEIRVSRTAALRPPSARPELLDPDVVDGEAHTVEIDVAQLRSLLATAEAYEAAVASP